MISFGLTDEQEVVREAMREFAEQVLRPAGRPADEASELPADVMQQVWDLSLTSTQLPESVGGGGEARSPITNAIILEELAFGDAGLGLAAASPGLFAFAVADFGTEEQQKQYLPAFGGQKFHAGALAVLEPSPVFDVTNLQTTAEAKGDSFVLSGKKRFVVMGDRAEHFLVLARSTNAAKTGFGAVDAFIVPRDAAGLSVGDVELNLGMKAVPTVSLTLEKVEVPAANRLGGEEGIDAARLIAGTRVAGAALLTGLSRGVLEFCIPYAKERHAFGEAIAQKQAVAFMLSDMQVEVESMRWLTWKAASQLEQGTDATKAAVFASRYAATQAMKIADNGVQVLGGHGFIREHPVEMWYRHARTLSVLEGVAAV
ncbi:MAG: acyl-CoA dehydrogenase family protein [Myxococcota bacterium]|nr:acyl-CoA dehydrogenase family protein [Myxococcota bacterium]